MIREFWLFIVAVWHEWKLLLTGGSVIAGLKLWSVYTKKSMPSRVDWFIVGLTLVLAFFLAWRNQWLQADKAFIDLSPAQLVALTRDRTKLHAQTSLKPYIGRRIKATCEFNDVSRILHMGLVYLRGEAGPGENMLLNKPTLVLHVWRWQLGPFIPLPQGTPLTVTGRIQEVDYNSIHIQNPQIVSNPPKQQTVQP